VTFGPEWTDHDLVFCQPDGRPIDPRRDWDEWGTILNTVGFPHLRVHDGRHTAGTLLINQDVHLRVVQEILGHTDIRVTQRYTHVSTAAARDAAERVGAALWPEH
jgi:site-specific recombinase XerD